MHVQIVTDGHSKQEQTIFFVVACSHAYARHCNARERFVVYLWGPASRLGRIRRRCSWSAATLVLASQRPDAPDPRAEPERADRSPRSSCCWWPVSDAGVRPARNGPAPRSPSFTRPPRPRLPSSLLRKVFCKVSGYGYLRYFSTIERVGAAAASCLRFMNSSALALVSRSELESCLQHISSARSGPISRCANPLLGLPRESGAGAGSASPRGAPRRCLPLNASLLSSMAASRSLSTSLSWSSTSRS